VIQQAEQIHIKPLGMSNMREEVDVLAGSAVESIEGLVALWRDAEAETANARKDLARAKLKINEQAFQIEELEAVLRLTRQSIHRSMADAAVRRREDDKPSRASTFREAQEGVRAEASTRERYAPNPSFLYRFQYYSLCTVHCVLFTVVVVPKQS
jgi:hypothetical protein